MKSSLLFCSFLAVLLLPAAFAGFAQTLTIQPAFAAADQVVSITASGLAPNQPVTLRAELQDGAGHLWQSEAKFLASASGSLDVSQSAPVSGSYHGVSPMGMVWSMRPAPGQETSGYDPPAKLAPQTIQFTLSTPAGSATAQLTERALSEGTQQIRVDGLFQAIFFVPPDTLESAGAPRQRRPTVLVLGGSQGGFPLRRAAWLASHGYNALALAYFRAPGLPSELRGIPLEYFGRAIGWLAQRPEVDPARIGVLGTSRGGELALQLASMFPQLHATVAFVPSNVRDQACCDGPGAAWTWAGRPLTYASGRAMSGIPDRDAQIAIENARGPILLISGGSDGIWSSSQMTEELVGRLRAAHFAYPVERLNYPKAGHRAGSPEIIPAWNTTFHAWLSGRGLGFGGTPEGDAASTLDAGPRVLAFLAEALGMAKTAAPLP